MTMSTTDWTSRSLVKALALLVAITLYVTLARAEVAGEENSLSVVDHEIPMAPATIEGIAPPDLAMPGSLEALLEIEFVVPALSGRSLEPPPIDVQAIRDASAAWLGDGVLHAPDGEIDVDPPEISAEALDASNALDGIVLTAPELRRPALPEPPPIR